VKRFYGEFLLGLSPQDKDEDPWSSFFTLLISFAEMYRTSRLELEEWKRSEEKAKANNHQKPRILSPRKTEPMEHDDRDRSVETPSPSKMIHTANVVREDILNVFKNKLAMIRQRNAPAQQDDSDSESDDGDMH
jgi:hypothetical protein